MKLKFYNILGNPRLEGGGGKTRKGKKRKKNGLGSHGWLCGRVWRPLKKPRHSGIIVSGNTKLRVRTIILRTYVLPSFVFCLLLSWRKISPDALFFFFSFYFILPCLFVLDLGCCLRMPAGTGRGRASKNRFRNLNLFLFNLERSWSKKKVIFVFKLRKN